MNPEEIKAGETYNVRVRVARIEPNRFVCRPLNQDGTPSAFCPNYFNFAEAEAFYPAENVTKSAKNAQKYDPCRKFREGDIVEPCQVKGRWLGTAWKDRSGIRFTVTNDEAETGTMNVKAPGSVISEFVDAVYFQLVTPVEELEPYKVDECGFAPTFNVRKNGKVYMTIPYKEGSSLFQTREEALAAAEAERDRLNAEYRKEQNNG